VRFRIDGDKLSLRRPGALGARQALSEASLAASPD